MIRRILCKLGRHGRLDLIQTFGSAQHIGCPNCGREMGIHHGMRAVIPWDADLADMYRRMGYDVDAHTAAWRKVRFPTIPGEE